MSEGRDRGQLMVVGAVLLALTILAIAALVNTAAYDRPAATQGGSEDAWEAMEYRDEMHSGLGGVIRSTNQGTQFVDYSELNNSFVAGARDWNRIHGLHESLRASGGTFSIGSTRNGTRIAQNVSMSLTSPGGSANWTVVRGVNDTRHFRINASVPSLTRTRGFGSGPRGDYHQSRYFRVNLTPETGATRGIYIYRNGTGADQQLHVRVDEGDGMSQRCSAAPDAGSDRVTVHLTEQQVGDGFCSPLDVFDDLEGQNYTISFGEGDEIKGTYELFVTDNSSEVRSVQNYASGSECLKFAENATYSASPTMEYANPDVRTLGGRWSVEPDDVRPLESQSLEDLDGGFPSEEIAYRGANMKSVNRSGVRTDYNGGGSAQGFGPHGFNLDDDAEVEIPYVQSGGNVRVTDPNDNAGTVVASGRDNYPVLWSGTWRDSEPSVFYPNGSSPDEINATNDIGGGTDRVVWTLPSGTSVMGIAGKGDVNTTAPGDELVWYDGDGDIHYLLNNKSASLEPGTSISFHANAGEGVGTPSDFNDDGQARIPYVTGDGKVALLNAETNATTTLTGTGAAKERSMATVDWDHDCVDEIAYLNQSDEITLLDDVGGENSISQIEDSDGDPVVTDPEVGVR